MIFPHTTSRILAAGALGAMLAAAATLPAQAFDSPTECHNAVNETTRSLLKANVANADLDEIDAVLVQATGKCDSGDLSGAEADLAKAGEMIEAASQ
ncbi:hypothetical protein [Salaquimonas pukyongi]|uniref:hypothetical protein n=1 Tax=Salaquimonas pukyongi TaxID=2712698 RepID=UPI00096B9410|nr:hypothetical protein [Salaquimonas pukyongi]